MTFAAIGSIELKSLILNSNGIAPNSFATAFNLASSRPVIITFAPFSINYFAVSFPIPEPPPVIRIVEFFISI